MGLIIFKPGGHLTIILGKILGGILIGFGAQDYYFLGRKVGP